jgi:hypothetical protein
VTFPILEWQASYQIHDEIMCQSLNCPSLDG